MHTVLTYDWHAGHLQHVGARMTHMRFRLAPAGYQSLASHQPYGILRQTYGQDVLAETRRPGQLKQRQIIAVRLCDAKVEARMDYLLEHAVLLHGQRLLYMPQILCIQLAQIHCYIGQLCLLYAMRRRCHHIRRYQHTAALILRDAYVRQPRVLGKLCRSSANDALLQRVLRYARQSTFRLEMEIIEEN